MIGDAYEIAMLHKEVGRLKECIAAGMAAHNEERSARDQLARENARLENVIRIGGAMYRSERAAMGIPGGIDLNEKYPEHIRVLAEEVLANKTRSHVGAAREFALFILGKHSHQ